MIEAILIGVVIAVAALILLIILIGAVKSIKSKKNKSENLIDAETNNNLETNEEKKVEPMKVVIAQGDSIVVGSEGRTPCGEYTMESCDGAESFNVRIGRYVREYKNGCTVVLTEKQKVTPVSTSIILR